MKLLCDDCRHEIKAGYIREDRHQFCDARCREKWKRRVARFQEDRRRPVGFGDA